jgi:hypothetical protein
MSSTGYSGIITPSNTSEWEAMVADVRAEFNGNAGSLQAVAAVLRKELPKATNVRGRKGWMGADLRIAAIQIAYHLNHSAASQIAAAVALTRANTIFEGTFAPAAAGQHAGRFDAGK